MERRVKANSVSTGTSIREADDVPNCYARSCASEQTSVQQWSSDITATPCLSRPSSRSIRGRLSTRLEVRSDPARQLVALIMALITLVREYHEAVIRLGADDAPHALRRLPVHAKATDSSKQ